MKIVRIIARLNVGGPARHVRWLTDALNDGEFQTVLVTGTVPAGEDEMRFDGIDAARQPIYIREMSRELSPLDAVALARIYGVLCRERPDIIHTHTAKAGTVGRVAAMLYRLTHPHRRVKVVHTFHGHVFHSYYGRIKTRIFIAIEKALARLATDRIVTISPLQRAEISGRFGIGRERDFRTIPLGIDLNALAAGDEHRQNFRNEVGAADDEIVVGFVGRLTEIKNVSMLIDAARLYLESSSGGGPRLRFVIVGDGHLRSALEDETAAKSVQTVVSFIGNRDDIAGVYAGLDVVALTSLNEGTPLSLIEAMAAGRAVAATIVGGVGDLLGGVVDDRGAFAVRERGIGVASGDAEGLFRALIYLAENGKLRQRLGADGRSFAIRHYGKERLIEDIKNLYRELGGARLLPEKQ